MNRSKAWWRNEERALLLAGLAGLGAAVIIACGSDGDSNGSSAEDSGAGTTNDSGGNDSGSSGSIPGVTATCSSDPSTAANTAAVVTAANALVAALTTQQQTDIAYDNTLTNAAQWSNFPTTFVQRLGVRIGDMSTEAQAAAVALVEVAAGATGSALFEQLREADEWLVTNGNASSTDYGRGLYYFSIHGTPSTSSPWMLQVAGHHLAYNYMYNSKCTSATPLFDGAEPMNWTGTDGVAHAPLAAQTAAMGALLASVGSLADAKLSGTYSDLVNGPGGGGATGGAPGGGGAPEGGAPGGGGGPGGGSSGGVTTSGGTATGGGDAKYPSQIAYPTGTTGRGVAVSTLSAEQKALVKSAIEAWVKNVADPVSSALLSIYESDEALNETFVAYSGSQDLSTQASYVRIDGPRVWIEASVQGGVIYHDIVHWHTVWRDKAADYGAEFIAQ